MPTPEQVKQLVDLGGLALFLAHVVIVDGYGLIRQWWVPGWIYRAVVAERDELKAENRELRKTVAQLLARERRRRASDRPDA